LFLKGELLNPQLAVFELRFTVSTLKLQLFCVEFHKFQNCTFCFEIHVKNPWSSQTLKKTYRLEEIAKCCILHFVCMYAENMTETTKHREIHGEIVKFLFAL